jgi:hypothetical protein
MGELLIMVFCSLIWLVIGLIIGYKIRRGFEKRYQKPVDSKHAEQNAALYGFRPAVDALSRLIRVILWDLHITPYRLEQMVKDYVDGLVKDTDQTPHVRSAIRGNLNKEIRASTVSWKVFMKFLKILKPRSVQFRVEIIMQDGTRSVNSIDLNSLDYVRSDG